MTGRDALAIGAAFVFLAFAALPGEAATKPGDEGAKGAKSTPDKSTPDSSSPIQILPGTSSKEPISIDADKLVYYDKEKKAIYSGTVVVVQGDTKMTCSTMTVYLERQPTANDQPSGQAAKSADNQGGPPSNSGVRRLEAAGPVTVVSKTQVATGDNGVYDKTENKVQLIGHVTMSDGQNVTKGDKLTYDLKTGQATVETAGSKTSRVHGQFTPNGGATAPDAAKAPQAAKPK